MMANNAPNASNICAIIVTFHPDIDFGVRLASITKQVSTVIVVDNGSTERETTQLYADCTNQKAQLVLNHENLGIATALNLGIKHAIKLNFEWVILFDQDSFANIDLIQKMCAIYTKVTNNQKVAIFAASYTHPKKQAATVTEMEVDWKVVRRAITSGSLMPTAIFNEIGGFKDDYFIDYVDLEFCLRAQAKGYKIVKTSAALMTHAVGDPVVHRLLWFKIKSTNHSADRRYYIARNHIAMLKAHKNSCTFWLVDCIKKSAKDALTVTFYESDKKAKIKAILQGVNHGLRNQLGKRST